MLTASSRYSGTVFWFAFRFLKSAHFCIVSSDRLRLTLVGVGHRPLEGSYVCMDRNSREVMGQNPLAEFVLLDKPDGGEACRVSSNVDSGDS